MFCNENIISKILFYAVAYEAVCLKQGGDNYSSLELKHLQKQHKLSQQR